MGNSPSPNDWAPVSESDRLAVKEELDRILSSPFFRSSHRYPALLQYVVESTLSGKSEDLKERTLGIEVFHRTPEYDTNADPVVRFSAGEVRRRIAQYYQENAGHSLIKIDLPVGSYVPFFSKVRPSEELELQSGEEASVLKSHDAGATRHVPSPPLQVVEPPLGPSPSRPAWRTGFRSGLLVGVFAMATIASITYLILSAASAHPPRTSIMKLWGPLLTNPDRVLIAAGRTHFEDKQTPEPPNATIEEHILRPEARVSLSAVQAISQVAGFLQSQHKNFQVREAYSSSLQDLHRLPVVLISGYNNIWTMLSTKSLRFHFEQVGSMHFIVDAQHPERRDWSVDFDTPYAQQTADYAIVARFNDATIDGPVVVVAGIGSNGTQAAGEFIVSPAAIEQLAQSAPHGSLDQNFEAVLKVEVIAGNTGAAKVVAAQFW
jgi:hypothetical protein